MSRAGVVRRGVCLAALLAVVAGGPRAQHAETALAERSAHATAEPSWPGLLPEPLPPPAAAAGTPMPVLLQQLIEHSRLPMPLQQGRLTGAGGERWRALAAASSHVVLGEQHGNEGIAALARAMWADLAGAGWRHAALEVDPAVASALQRSLREGGPAAWARWLAARGGPTAVPFVGWAGEVSLAAAVPQLWGLDQVFIGIAPALLRDLPATPGLPPAVQAMLQSLADEAAASTGWLGRADPARLRAAARKVEAGNPARALLEALADSAVIYAPFSSGSEASGSRSEVTMANAQREQLMKRLFAAQHRQAEQAEGRAPRVFVKVGAWHAMRGATPGGAQGLGGFVSEFAAARDQAVLTLMVLCGPGSEAATHGGSPQPCDSSGPGSDWAFLRPWIDSAQPTLFDLRTWRMRPRRLQGLPAEVLRAVGSFDLLVFVPAAPAATVLPPP